MPPLEITPFWAEGVDKGAGQSVASGIGQDADLTDDNTDAGVFGDAMHTTTN